MYIEYIITISTSIVLGVVGSIIAWWIVNIIFSPNFKISDDILYNSKGKPYIKVYNISLLKLNAYDVVGYVYYYKKETSSAELIFRDEQKPILTCTRSEMDSYIIKLEEDCPEFERCFQVGNKIKVVVTGQNRFGIKKTFISELIINDDPTKLPPIKQICHNGSYN